MYSEGSGLRRRRLERVVEAGDWRRRTGRKESANKVGRQADARWNLRRSCESIVRLRVYTKHGLRASAARVGMDSTGRGPRGSGGRERLRERRRRRARRAASMERERNRAWEGAKDA
eukprot:3671935-Pleurochrysis_carterae.AAC.2